jgi:hypothetical protein
MKKFLKGDFSFKASDGALLGKIKFKDTSGWNIRPFLKRRGGEVDDYIVLTFNIRLREAKGYIGDIDLLDGFRL